MRSQLYPFKVLAAIQCIWISVLLFMLVACNESDQAPASSPAAETAREELPSPVDPEALAALSDFKTAFKDGESKADRFHVLSRKFYRRQQIGQIFVGCELDGKNERICLLDTGSAVSSLPEDAFTLSYESAGKAFQFLRGKVTQVGHSIDLNSFVAGGAYFGKTRFMRLFPSYYPVNLASQGIDGVIGEDILLSSGLQLNFKNGTLQFGRIADREDLPYRFHLNLSQQVVMPVSLNGEATEAVFDTGASITAVDKKWIQAHSEQFEALEDAAERTFSGELNRTHIYRVRSLKVGEAEFSSLYVIALDFARMPWLDPKTTVILGYNVISKGSWKLDYPSLGWSFSVPLQLQ
jgi:hypothetical protein